MSWRTGMDRKEECFIVTEPVQEKDRSNGKKHEKQRTMISVKEMGDLLGLKKTERYWLVHKNVFETKTIIGKMWVDIATFENWYANQLKYKKVSGEQPGKKIREWSYSVRDISQMLGICEAGAYDLIKRKAIETIIIDDRIRVSKKAFQKWYVDQTHYRTREDRLIDAQLEKTTLSLPQIAALLGISRNKVYSILRDNRYRSFFEIIVVADRRRVTKNSFAAFLKGQDRYRLCTEVDDKHVEFRDRKNKCRKKEYDGRTAVQSDLLKEVTALQALSEMNAGIHESAGPAYISFAEAASRASMSRQAISRYAQEGCFELCRIGKVVRISRNSFERWLASRQEKYQKFLRS